MVCHYCGYEEPKPSVCPKCQSRYLFGFKAGTQQVEDSLRLRFPEARILRMDADTTKKKDDYEKILAAFANRDADILIGTQMIVKGHDFPGVTLMGVLAADLYAVFNSDGTPWPMLARMGGGQRMRGYYQGRYTDNDMITVQVELRQRIWRRIGCAVWGGAGNVFPSLSRFDWSQTLPNYGAGLRWELKKRVNVRLDYGFGKKTSGFLLNINEAF